MQNSIGSKISFTKTLPKKSIYHACFVLKVVLNEKILSQKCFFH